MKEIGPESWKRLRQLLDRALEVDGDARRAFVDSLEGEDAALRDDLVRALAQHEKLGQQSMANAMEMAIPAVADSIRDDAVLDQTRVGQTIGPYRLVRLLGAGGMGTVYLAERFADGFTHQVALKLMRHALFSASSKERFDRERQILAALNYPGVALLFDGGQTPEGQAYYTMEYVDGLPIVDFCRKHELTVKARVELLLQVATVLAYAHQNLIVHRDIKSSNVLVTSDGRAKLVDFGLAKLLDIHASPAMTVEAGPMTPAYAAPEQFYNGAITASTDIYQFGVLCFVTLTARLPYRADPNDGLNWARAVTEQEPMTLAQAAGSEKDGEPHLRRQLTRDLDAIIRKGIAKEPIQRYRSMDALIADLEAFLDSRPIRARRAGPFYFIWRFVRRWRYAVVPAVGLVIAWGLTALVANRSILYWLQRSNGASVEVTRANAVSAFLTDLFQSPDLGESAKRGNLSLEQLLDRSEKHTQAAMASAQPTRRAYLESIAGEAYMVLGDLPRGRAALQTTVDVLRALPGADPNELGHSLRMLAWNVYLQGDPAAALPLLADGEASLRKVPGPQALSELVDVRSNRGSMYTALGQLVEARVEFEQAIASARQLKLNLLRVAGFQEHLGVLLRGWRNTEALDVLQQALSTYNARLGEDDPMTSEAMQNVAVVLTEIDDLKAAEPLIEKALQRNSALYGEQSTRYAASLIARGNFVVRRAEFEKASEDIRNARDIYRQIEGAQATSVAAASRQLGRVYLDQGNATAAFSEIENALIVLRANKQHDVSELAYALDLAVETQLALGLYADAAADAEQAAPLFQSRFPSDHPALVRSLVHRGLARHAIGDANGARAAWDEALVRTTTVDASASVEMTRLRAAIADPESILQPQRRSDGDTATP